ncbi:LAMI_0F00430g1_1 [Lachancea mirantina]|uniref:LAMI_0F00430g1_1 n=1 Tax=Lachancea mirantina TaxID=1230905 RepID=A0A1G4JVC3_9SACH|nr:LAMI_0F00430g1_1 [Lachancea mirantina]
MSSAGPTGMILHQGFPKIEKLKDSNSYTVVIIAKHRLRPAFVRVAKLALEACKNCALLLREAMSSYPVSTFFYHGKKNRSRGFEGLQFSLCGGRGVRGSTKHCEKYLSNGLYGRQTVACAPVCTIPNVSGNPAIVFLSESGFLLIFATLVQTCFLCKICHSGIELRYVLPCLNLGFWPIISLRGNIFFAKNIFFSVTCRFSHFSYHFFSHSNQLFLHQSLVSFRTFTGLSYSCQG